MISEKSKFTESVELERERVEFRAISRLFRFVDVNCSSTHRVKVEAEFFSEEHFFLAPFLFQTKFLTDIMRCFREHLP